ncbi:hypothetical protein [Desulfosarcina ovata]|uniref:Uncharacterized protein n=2 Tax=Desulfosarcina ovata TaxID=83564 RepID=A0A5K8A7R9_9BACT|nr:hypothetical protein [Desulfosarcina ovata]BBO81416.1 hypothetical protein DSCO28_19820 [Desulfosarcina ovata subsp. sediminis]BBO88672.1 hypothetical protein DSCOOX_18520 [Desulfosarcina ovata subsp. ovata]
MSIEFVKDHRINGRYISQYHNDKTSRKMVFIDGVEVEKSFVQACSDCKQKDGKTHEKNI